MFIKPNEAQTKSRITDSEERLLLGFRFDAVSNLVVVKPASEGNSIVQYTYA